MNSAPEAGRRRLLRYWDVVAWLGGDVLRNFRYRCLWIAALMMVSLVLRLGALLVLSRYIHLVEAKASVALPYFGPQVASESYLLLGLASVACLVLFLVGFLAKYMAETRSLRVAAEQEVQCVREALDGIGRYGGDPHVAQFQPVYIKLIGNDSRVCGMVTRLGIRLMLPVTMAVGTLACLVYLDAVLTAILAVLALATLPLLYRINVRSAKFSMAFERESVAANLAKRQAAEAYARHWTKAPRKDVEPVTIDDYLNIGTIRTSMSSFTARLKANEESNLVISVLMGVAVFAILVHKGFSILDSHQGWAFITVYFILLRVCLSAFLQAANILTTINRMYPQLKRYQTFILTVRQVRERCVSAPPQGKFWAQAKGAGPTLNEEELE